MEHEDRLKAARAEASAAHDLLRRLAGVSEVIEAHSIATFDYTNHRGVSERRTVTNCRMRVQPAGEEFYAGQWVLRGYCESRHDMRDFLIASIENITGSF